MKTTQNRQQLLAHLGDQGGLLSNATVMYHQAAAEKFGLNATDMKTLPILTERGPISAGDLAISLNLTTGAVTSVIDRLEKVGLVRREPDPKDRRKIQVIVSPEGLANAYKIYGPMANAMQKLGNEYTSEELEVIIDFLTKSTNILSDEAFNLRNKQS